MTTSPTQGEHAQTEALRIEAAYEGETLIGYRLTGSGNPESRALVWVDQRTMPGIRAGNEFVPDYGKSIAYLPVPLHAQPAAPTTAAQADSVLEDAALLHYALADGGNQSMNWQDVYDDWSGEGYFIDALRAAYKQDAARKQGDTHD